MFLHIHILLLVVLILINITDAFNIFCIKNAEHGETLEIPFISVGSILAIIIVSMFISLLVRYYNEPITKDPKSNKADVSYEMQDLNAEYATVGCVDNSAYTGLRGAGKIEENTEYGRREARGDLVENAEYGRTGGAINTSGGHENMAYTKIDSGAVLVQNAEYGKTGGEINTLAGRLNENTVYRRIDGAGVSVQNTEYGRVAGAASCSEENSEYAKLDNANNTTGVEGIYEYITEEDVAKLKLQLKK